MNIVITIQTPKEKCLKNYSRCYNLEEKNSSNTNLVIAFIYKEKNNYNYGNWNILDQHLDMQLTKFDLN